MNEHLNDDLATPAVVGAFALAIHGAQRASADVDALLCVSPARLKQLGQSLRSAGFDANVRSADAEDPVQGLVFVRDGHGNQVDLLGGLAGMDRGLFGRAIEIPFADGVLRFAGREDFIAMKCYVAGPQDLEDARFAYEDARSSLDMDLLRVLTRGFGREAADNLERVLATNHSPGAPRS